MGVQTDSTALEICADRLAAGWHSSDGSRSEPRLDAAANELSRLEHLTTAGDEYRQLLIAVIEDLLQFPDSESLELYYRVVVHVRDRCRAGCA
jgi:hypothetical protein